MINEHYWFFEEAVPEKICDEIVEYGVSIKDKMAIVGNSERKNSYNQKEVENLQKIRNSNVVFLSEKWLYREIQPWLKRANINAGWNFQWDYTEPLQFTKYNTKQFYGWHQDQHPDPYRGRNNFFNDKIRKLSCTLLLNDSKEYEGGELEFAFFGHPEKKMKTQLCKIKRKGALVVFPSFVWHRVKPVTKGVRYSLVGWSLGYPYR